MAEINSTIRKPSKHLPPRGRTGIVCSYERCRHPLQVSSSGVSFNKEKNGDELGRVVHYRSSRRRQQHK